MVENRPILDFICHLILIVGVAIVALPVYIAIIASTHGNNDFLSGMIPLLPGTQMLNNYAHMLGVGISTSGAPPLGPMLLNSLVMALTVAIGQDRRSRSSRPSPSSISASRSGRWRSG